VLRSYGQSWGSLFFGGGRGIAIGSGVIFPCYTHALTYECVCVRVCVCVCARAHARVFGSCVCICFFVVIARDRVGKIRGGARLTCLLGSSQDSGQILEHKIYPSRFRVLLSMLKTRHDPTGQFGLTNKTRRIPFILVMHSTTLACPSSGWHALFAAHLTSSGCAAPPPRHLGSWPPGLPWAHSPPTAHTPRCQPASC
jgi:hypothetical protein